MIEPNIEPHNKIFSDGIRYFVIAVIGLIVDFIIALTLIHVFSIPLPIATSIGFLVAVSINYVLLERFLFFRTTLSWKRLVKTYLSAQGALIVRIATAWALTSVWNGNFYKDAAVLIISSVVSFLVNFFIVRFLLR